MSLRHLTAVAALAAACAIPAHAAYHAGLNTQFGGFVVAQPSVSLAGPQVAGQCTYTGQEMVDGRMQFQFGGTDHATSTGTTQAQVTDVKCTLTSPAQGLPGEQPTRTATFEAACPLVSCASASTVSGWPVRPVVVCVDGWAIYGPTPVTQVTMAQACKTSTL